MPEIAEQMLLLATYMYNLSEPDLGRELHRPKYTHAPEKMTSY